MVSNYKHCISKGQYILVIFTKFVQVQLREALQPEEARQVASGETLSQTRVELKPLGSEMFCAREILWEQILIPVREFENETFFDTLIV